MNQYYGVTRSDDHLAHYGVKGMKWGVRRAVLTGDSKSLDKHFRKASKKLSKLQSRGLEARKHLRRAAVLGTGAAAATGAAIAGTKGTANVIKAVGHLGGKAADIVGTGMVNLGSAMQKAHIRGGGKMYSAGNAVKMVGVKARYAGNKVNRDLPHWGKGNTVLRQGKIDLRPRKVKHDVSPIAVKNEPLFRIGSGLAALGLGAAAARNAYLASPTGIKKSRQKAVNFKREMDKAFKGTRYEGHYVVPPKQKKRG